MVLNDFGRIAYNEWIKLPQRFSNVELDVFQIMPNHMHGIIVLSENIVGATLAVAQKTSMENTTIGDIVGAYKSLVANSCLGSFKYSIEMGVTPEYEKMGKLWQRNYHEHIIRDERSYQNISNYIMNNPAKWKEDKFHK